MGRPLLFFFSLLAATGCSSGSPEGGPVESALPASLEAPAECPVATRPSLVSGGCEPVGPTNESPGFARDARGWGYDAVLPKEICTGATMAVLGHSDCQPTDDCGAPFPPPGADVVVRDGESIQEAIRTVREGGLIAVDAGVYEAVSTQKSVRIVGRCASQVVIRSPNTFPKAPPPGTKLTNGGAKGVDVLGAAVNIELRSLTVRGFDSGLYLEKGKATLDRVVFSGNRVGVAAVGGTKLKMTHSVVEPHVDYPRSDAMGISVMLLANEVTLEEIDIRGMDTGVTVNSPDTKLLLRRSVIHDEHLPVYRGAAFEALRGATARIEESALFTNKGMCAVAGRFVGDPPALDANAGAAKVTIRKSTLVHAGSPSSDPKAREGAMTLWDGAAVELEDTSVRYTSFGAFAVTTGSSLKLKRSVVSPDGSDAPTRFAAGVYDRGSKLEMEDSAVVGAAQVGLFVHDRNVMVSLNRSLVTGTRHRFTGDLSDIGGTGQAIAIGHGARLDLSDSALVANEGLGVFGIDEATIRLDRSIIDDTRATPESALGAGVVVTASTLHVEGSLVRKSADAALAFDASSGIVTSASLADNTIAVRTSGGTSLVETKSAPLDVEAGHAVLHATRLERNASSFREEALALP